jgi:hypothetical protein
VLAPWPGTKNTIRGKVMASPKSKTWWILWVHVCSLFVRPLKMLQFYVLTNLLFGFCKSMWVIDLLVILHSPHPKAPARPSTPKMLQTREHAPIPCPSDVFTLWIHNWVDQIVRGVSVTFIQSSDHYHKECQMIRCCLLSLLTMLKQKSTSWGKIILSQNKSQKLVVPIWDLLAHVMIIVMPSKVVFTVIWIEPKYYNLSTWVCNYYIKYKVFALCSQVCKLCVILFTTSQYPMCMLMGIEINNVLTIVCYKLKCPL